MRVALDDSGKILIRRDKSKELIGEARVQREAVDFSSKTSKFNKGDAAI
jgi:hypothetical protein